MTSIIKVDQIQTASGVTPTADDLGINTAGTVLQVVQSVITGKITINNSTAKWGELSLTTKENNSSFLVEIIIGVGGQNTTGNIDRDIVLACGYKTGSISSSHSDYSSVSTQPFGRESVGSLGSWYAEDASTHAGSYSGYMVRPFTFKRLFSPSLSSETTLNVSQWVGSDGIQDFGASDIPGYSDSGLEQSITITEIAV